MNSMDVTPGDEVSNSEEPVVSPEPTVEETDGAEAPEEVTSDV